MTLQQEAENNLKKIFFEDDLYTPTFVSTSKGQVDLLYELLGTDSPVVSDFYKNYQPDRIPDLKSKSVLLNIDSIIEENSELAPGIALSKLGIYVFAKTIGGNVICIDTNDSKEGDPVVLIIDQSFLYIDTDEDEVEIANLPSYIDEDSVADDDYEFNYENVRKFVYKIADSFTEFIEKYSRNEYDDLEKYL